MSVVDELRKSKQIGVDVAKGRFVEWPDECAYCCKPLPSAQVRILPERTGILRLLLPRIPFDPSLPTIEAPVCHSCRWPLRRAMLFRRWFTWIVVVPLIIAEFHFLTRVGVLPSGPIRPSQATWICFATAIALRWIERRFPPRIEVISGGRNLEFRFSRISQAFRFADVNGT